MQHKSILKARCMYAKSLQPCPTIATLWTVDCQAPLSGIPQARILKRVTMPSSPRIL